MSAPLTLASQVAALNDAFRTSGGIGPVPGMIVVTCGIHGLPCGQQTALMGAVIQFNAFTEDNDPYGEHDFGSLRIEDAHVFWKIDVYADAACEFGSQFPADPSRSFRVLTIMLAEEY